MQPQEEILLDHWYIKMDLPLWIDADFGCMKLPFDDPNK